MAKNLGLEITSAVASGGNAHVLSTTTDYSAGNLLVLQDNGTNKFVVRHDGAIDQDLTVTGDLTVSGTGPHAIGGMTRDYVQVGVLGAFTSGGGSTAAAGLAVATSLTGAAGDTNRLFLAEFGDGIIGASITTQGSSETIVDVGTLVLREPNITVGAGDSITNASTVKIQSAPTEGTNNYALWVDAGTTRFDGTVDVRGEVHSPLIIGNPDTTDAYLQLAASNTWRFVSDDGSGSLVFRDQTNTNNVMAIQAGAPAGALTVSTAGDLLLSGELRVTGAGPHGIGNSPNTAIQLDISGSYSSSGTNEQTGVRVASDLTISSEATVAASLFRIGWGTAHGITTPGTATTFAAAASLYLKEPNITLGAGDSFTTASTVHILSAPTEGDSNYALYVEAGLTRLDGNLELQGDILTASGTAISFSGTDTTVAGDLTVSGASLTVGGTEVVLESRTITAGTGLTGGGDLSADRTLNVSGLTDTEIAAGAEISVSKLADGAARQVLQTDAAGTGVEWTSDVDLPGTLDVTGAVTLDADFTVSGAGPHLFGGALEITVQGADPTGVGDKVHLYAKDVDASAEVFVQNEAGEARQISGIPGGGLVLIEAQTASSSSSIDFTTGIDDTYDEYIFRIQNAAPATLGELLIVLTSSDGGSSYDNSAGDYERVALFTDAASGTTTTQSSLGSSEGRLSDAGQDVSNNSVGWSGEIRMIRPAASEFTVFIFSGAYLDDGEDWIYARGAFHRDVKDVVDAVRFEYSGATIASGEFKLYGVVKS